MYCYIAAVSCYSTTHVTVPLCSVRVSLNNVTLPFCCFAIWLMLQFHCTCIVLVSFNNVTVPFCCFTVWLMLQHQSGLLLCYSVVLQHDWCYTVPLCLVTGPLCCDTLQLTDGWQVQGRCLESADCSGKYQWPCSSKNTTSAGEDMHCTSWSNGY